MAMVIAHFWYHLSSQMKGHASFIVNLFSPSQRHISLSIDSVRQWNVRACRKENLHAQTKFCAFCICFIFGLQTKQDAKESLRN